MCDFVQLTSVVRSLISAVGFDAIYVQFCACPALALALGRTNAFFDTSTDNNPECGSATGSEPWNFKQWDDWAKKGSPNKSVRIYAGFPGDEKSAGSGYVKAGDLQGIFKKLSKYTSFGGAMVWDVSSAYRK